MALTLRYQATTTVPVEVEGILPHVVREMAPSQIERLEIFHGNQALPLAEFFQVSGDAADEHLIWEGDLSGVHWIGAHMTTGRMRVAGHAGRHVGSQMQGGQIDVEGDAGDWLGGELHGGLIHVRGRAGHLVGAAYRGSRRGMTGGTILVEGGAGNEIGHTMRRGLIVIGGSCGDLAGFNMLAGTILVLGDCGIRHGAGMRRGTIGLLGKTRPPLLATFRYGCRFQPAFLRLLCSQLQQHGFPVPAGLASTPVDLYHGDLIEGGRGEILLPAVA